MATITASATGGNANATGSWVGSVVPGINDDVLLTATSGNIANTASISWKSLTCTGYTGTFSGSGGITVTGNVVFVTGMTFTWTGQLVLNNTTGTSQLTFGGKSFNTLVRQAVGGSTQVQDAFAVSGTTQVTGGTLDFNGKTGTTGLIQSTGSNACGITCGAATMTTGNWNLSGTNLTLSAASSTITVNANGANFSQGNYTWGTVTLNISGSSSFTITGNNTFGNLTLTNTTGNTNTNQFILVSGSTNTVTGTLTVTGASVTSRLWVLAQQLGTSATLVCANPPVLTNVDFTDTVGSGGGWATATISSVGDFLGNTNIPFTPAVVRYAVGLGTANKTWSTTTMWSATTGGATGVSIPICHDTVIFDTNTGAGHVLTISSIRVPSIDLSGLPGAITISGSVISVRGDVNMTNATTWNGNVTVTLYGRSAQKVTNGGCVISNVLAVNAPGGTYTFQDAMSGGTISGVTVTSGAVDLSTFSHTMANLIATGTAVRSLSSTGTVTLTGTGVVVNITATGLTATTSTMNIVVANTSATAKTVTTGGVAVGGVTYTAGTGTLTLSNGGTYEGLTGSGAVTTWFFTAGQTYTLPNIGSLNINGSSGNLILLRSTSSGSTFTIALGTTGTATVSYLDVKDSTATGTNTPINDALGGVDSGNNTGWKFISFISRLGLMGVG